MHHKVHRGNDKGVHGTEGGMIMTVLEKNIQIIKDMHAAFNKGDLPAVLGYLADDIDWQAPVTGTRVKEISWSKPRRGRKEVESFFKELTEKVKPGELEILTITGQDDRIIVEGKTRGTVIATGCAYKNDWIMAFTLRDAKVVRFRQYYDSADVAAAFHAKGEECAAIPKAA